MILHQISKEELEKIRFVNKVMEQRQKNCWIWKSAKEGKYPSFNYLGRQMGAHRASYIIFKGAIPKGMEVCHSCDNPNCVNPDHLSVGTHVDNMAGRDTKFGKGNRKMTDEELLDIIQLLNDGFEKKEIINKYGKRFSSGYLNIFMTVYRRLKEVGVS